MFSKLVKNVIAKIGILCCLLVFTLNIVYVSSISDTIGEIVITQKYGIFNTLITMLLIIGILILSKKIDKIIVSKEIKIAIFIVFLTIYTIAQIFWINLRQATPMGDQKAVYNPAISIYENRWDDLKGLIYFERCPQQITLAVSFGAIFKIFSNTSVRFLQYLNVTSNVMTVLGILLITKNLEKNYKVNKSLAIILIGTFFTLPLLSTFVYGDLMSLPMCLFSVYFIMKYGMEKKKIYAILSAVFMAIAYMLRMNNLIFVIAITIYLILNILQENTIKIIIPKISLLIIFITIAILPATIIRNSVQAKLGLDKEKQIPTLGYLYMGMEEGYRANGWYNEYGAWAWDDIETAEAKYKNAIVERIKYLIQNPGYTIKFYAKKVASMWTENTYASLWYNQTFNFQDIHDGTEIDELLREKNDNLLMYQKAIVIIIFGISILVIILNRKNLSNELILIITIFIGGFLFHVLWEAKSRYIIPYIIVMIPVASICIENLEQEYKKCLKNFKNPFTKKAE